jgi:hypothetical protein
MRENHLPDDLCHRVSTCLSVIHHFMLNECHQIPFVGNTDRTIVVRENASSNTLNSSTTNSRDHFASKKMHHKDTKEIKLIDLELPNYPYSRILLYEQMKVQDQRNLYPSQGLNIFLGPETFRRFVRSFWYLFTSKAAICERDIIRLNKVLSTLNKTREEADAMRAHINQLRDQYEASEKETASLLEILIYKSMILEKLRAKLALPGSLPGYVYRENGNDSFSSEDDTKWLMQGE